jgi:MoxR-like ATPase
MAITHAEVRRLADTILSEIERAVIGKRDTLELILLGLLADGHVLIDDYPGLAKTLMARSFARVMGLGFGRVQFTPDLVPSDITGWSIYDQRAGESEFRPGPVFTNVLLTDEINRAPAKTQAALLEAMQERQVTVEGTTYPLPRPFVVLATQNPIEFEGTYPLPEAQLDRFLMRIRVGYPSNDDQWRILERRLERGIDEVDLAAVAGPDDLEHMKESIEDVYVSESVGRYIVAIVEATRAAPRVQVGSSPRGSLALMKLARAKAALDGRDFVTPEDVKILAVPSLAHRLTLRPEAWVTGIKGESVVEEVLDHVPTPPSDPSASDPSDAP